MSKPIYLNEAEHRQVSDAVAAAERQSAGEIVTVIADRSDGYSDIALAWAAIAAFAAMALFSAFPEFYLTKFEWLLGLWGHEWSPRETLSIALAIGVVKFIAVVLVQLWQPLKFWLIPGWIKTARAENHAIDLFKVSAERRTHGRTGVMIYLSMREHRAEIVADEAIAAKVAPEVWGDAMSALLAELKQGRIADGMVAAVAQVGQVLAEHFPRAEDDTNELPDRLIEI